MRSPARTTTNARRGGPPLRSGGRLGSDEVTVSGPPGAMPGHVTPGGGGAQHCGERAALRRAARGRAATVEAGRDGASGRSRAHRGPAVGGCSGPRGWRAVGGVRWSRAGGAGEPSRRLQARIPGLAWRVGRVHSGPSPLGARRSRWRGFKCPRGLNQGGVTVSTGVLNVRIACRGCSHSHAKICGNHSCQRWQLRPYGHRRLTRGDISAQGASVGTGV